MLWPILIVLVLVVLNGFFAMSELAIVSSRRQRLETMAKAGSRGAARALKLGEDPTSFLSTVQVGITLIGIFAGAYSGATLSEPLADALRGVPGLARVADTTAFALVVIATTYVSLIIGELVPKRLALRNAEGIAAFVSGPMSLLAAIGAPIVWFLRVSTEAVLGLLGLRGDAPSAVTEEEVKAMIAEGTEVGVFHEAERELLEGVIRFADRPLRAIMLPRHAMVWLDVDGSLRGGGGRGARLGPLAVPALRGLDRRRHRLRPRQGPARPAAAGRPRPARGRCASRSTSARPSRRSG